MQCIVELLVLIEASIGQWTSQLRVLNEMIEYIN